MTLPANGIAWPPKPFDRAFKDIDEYALWWVGTSSKLSTFYSRRDRIDQFGFGEKLAAKFGYQKSDRFRATPNRVHLPVAADLCRLSASLLFAEPPTATIADDAGNDGARDRLDMIVNTPAANTMLLTAGESAAALTGVFLRAVWDTTIADHVWIDKVDADRAIPEFRWGRLTAVTFWSELPCQDDKTIIRHLERYEPGRILHGLYVGDGQTLGMAVPLTEHPLTGGLATVVNMDGAIETGAKKIAAAYVPNVQPNAAWRNDPTLQYLGRSDIAGDVIPLMAAVDEVYNALLRDVRLSKARLLLPDYMTESMGPGKGTIDLEAEAYTPYAAPPNGQAKPEIFQADIRVAEHQQVIDSLLREILRRTGYSPMSFGMEDTAGAVTATEISARDRASLITRASKIRLWQSALTDLLPTVLQVDAAMFGTGATVSDSNGVDVEFPPAVQESTKERADTVNILSAAGAASTKTMVEMIHPDWDDTQVDDEVALIKDSKAPPVSILGPGESDFGAPPVDDAESQDDSADEPVDDAAPPVA